jgi:hypothetical protein
VLDSCLPDDHTGVIEVDHVIVKEGGEDEKEKGEESRDSEGEGRGVTITTSAVRSAVKWV